MFDAEKCIAYIKAMPKEQFHETIIRGVAGSDEFSCLVSIGLKHLSEEDKKYICKMLQNARVPIEYSTEEEFGRGLTDVANIIAARAVSVS